MLNQSCAGLLVTLYRQLISTDRERAYNIPIAARYFYCRFQER